MKTLLTLIVAMDENRLIASAGGIPWHLPRDVAHFRHYTKDKWLLMGRRTYEQMLGWFRPGHVPLVLTRNKDWKPERGAAVASVEEAMRMTEAKGQSELVCVGGGQVYAAALPLADRIVITLIRERFTAGEGAVYFPEYDETNEWEIEEEDDYIADTDNKHAMSIFTMCRRPSAL